MWTRNIKCMLVMLVRTFHFIVGGWNKPGPAQWESYLHGPELEAMNALKLWHTYKQIPRGVVYNLGQTNGVLLSAPVRE